MMLTDQYVAAFRKIEGGARPDAKTVLKELSANVSKRVVPAKHVDAGGQLGTKFGQ